MRCRIRRGSDRKVVPVHLVGTEPPVDVMAVPVELSAGD
jgi:hypothetical protein